MSHTDAFLLLQVFRRRALPTLLRRLQAWKGLDRYRNADLVEDVEQELWLDCLQNATEIVALPTRERHLRWFRIAERTHYRLHTRVDRLRIGDAVLEAVPDPATGSPGAPPTGADGPRDPVEAWGAGLPRDQRRFLRRLAARATYLKNGRINCRESARSLGMRAREVKARWSEIAADLGFDAEYLEFWRRRLVEALLGLAADLLRDQGRVTVHDEPRRRPPDPAGRLRRIRELYRRFACRPIPRDLKHVFAHYHRRSSAEGLDPVVILDHAALLRPADPSVQLWRFEALLAAGDPRGAMAAIRAARAAGAAPVPVLLARARLLEFRRQETAARHLLARRSDGTASDPRLRAALGRLAG